MVKIHHLNCVNIISPFGAKAIGHCLLLEDKDSAVLIDTGIGLKDVQNPQQRIGQELIDIVGYQFNENTTAIRQIESLVIEPNKITDCVISHLDNDHIGGLADFPHATVHVGAEEWENYLSGNSRYLKRPLDHQPDIKLYSSNTTKWFGFEARKVDVPIDAEIYLIPLFGHTLGHCGVAVLVNNSWIFYVGDAYYLHDELTDENHPINELAKLRADDDHLRIDTLNKLRQFRNENPEIAIFGYHDESEFQEFYV